MKRRDLERHLADDGCIVLREGANHTIWHNPNADQRTPVPRHREIPKARSERSAANYKSRHPPAPANH